MAVDGSVIISTEITNDQYRKGLDDMTKASKAWAKGTQADFNAVSKGSFDLVSTIKAGVAAFAGLKAVEVGKDALMAAARYQTLGITLDQVGKNIGKLPEQMKVYEDALQDTGIAALEARSSIIQLATANLDLEKSAELARVAQNLAVVSGLSSAESFERMTQGIIGGQPLILRAIGLNVSFEQSYIDFAKTLNTTADQLTEQQKVQARMNIVLKEGANFAGVYEEAMETAGKQIASLSRYVSNLSVKVGGVGLDALAIGVKDFTGFMKEANAQMDEWEKSGGMEATSRALGESFKTISDNIGVAAVALAAYVVAQKISNTAMGQSITAQISFAEKIATGNASLYDAAKATQMRAVAQHEALEAELAAVKATEAKAIADLAAAEAAQKRAVSSRQILQADGEYSRALRGVLQAQNERIAVEGRLVASTGLVDATQKKATISARLLAGAQAGIAAAGKGISSIFSGVVSMLGGPVMAALTAATVAISYMATRQTAADRVARDHANALALVKDGLDKASDSTKTFIESLQRMTEVQARAKLKNIDKEAKELAKSMKNNFELIEITGFWSTGEQQKFDSAIKNYITGVEDFSRLSSEELKKVKDDLSALSIAAGREQGMQGYFDKLLDKLIAVRFESEEINKIVQVGAQNNADLTARWAAEAAKLAGQTDKLRESLGKVSGTISTFEEADKVLDALYRTTEKGKKAAEESARKRATEALTFMQNAAAANELAAAILQLEAHELRLAGATAATVQALLDQSMAMRKSAGEASALADKYSKGLPEFKFDTGKTGGKPAAETIREIREQIEQLTRTSPETVAEKLAKGLADIAEKARNAQLPVGEVAKLTGELTAKMEEFRKATEKEFLRDFNRDIADMTGNMELVNQIDLEKKLEDIQSKMLALGASTEQVAAAQDKFKDAYEKQIQVKDLQTTINFLKELEGLSGAYGLSIAKQNQLIELQAQIYRENLGPEMQSLVDTWEQLQKREIDPSWDAGIERSAAKFVAEWTNAGKVAEKQFDLMIGAVQDLGGSAIDAIFDNAEFRADQFFKDLAKQLLKLAMNQAIAGLFGTFFGVKTSHSGSIVGVPDSNPTRRIALAAPQYIPKFHTGGIVGMSSTEQLTLLQKGEGVFTPAQMRALAPVGAGSHEYTVNQDVSFHIEGGGGGVASAIDQSTMTELSRQMKQATNAAISEFIINQRRAGGMFSGGLT